MTPLAWIRNWSKSPPLPAAMPFSPPQLSLLVGLLITGVWVGWQLRFPEYLTGGDDLTHVLLSRAIAEGHYRDLYLPGTPLHAHYPPGMALWLLAIRTVFGEGLAPVQFMNLLLVAGTASLTADALRRLGFSWFGLLAAGLLMFNPTLVGLAGTALSEIPFTALTSLSLWAALRCERDVGAPSRRWIFLAFAVALAAFLTRSNGVALLAGLLGMLLVRGRWRAAVVGAAGTGLIVGGWFGYVRWASRQTVANTYVADLSSTAPSTGLVGLASRALSNLRFYVQEAMPDLLSLPMIPGRIADNLAWTAVLGVAGVAGVIWLSRRWITGVLTLLATLAILAIWPWGFTRLAAPLLPFGLTAILIGAAQVRSPWGRRPSASWFAPLLAAALGISTLNGVRVGWQLARECPRADVYATPSRCTVPEERAFMAGVRLARDLLPPSAVVASVKPTVVYHFGQRRGVPLSLLMQGGESVAVGLERAGATHILVSRMRPAETDRVIPWLLQRCRELASVAPITGPAALLAPRRDGMPDACATLEQLRGWRALSGSPPPGMP